MPQPGHDELMEALRQVLVALATHMALLEAAATAAEGARLAAVSLDLKESERLLAAIVLALQSRPSMRRAILAEAIESPVLKIE